MINRIVSFAKGLKRLWSLASAEGGDAREAKAQADNGVYLKSIESLSRLTKEIDFLRYQVDSWPSRRLPLKFGGRRLRVGLTYNMANNFYNLCNALRRAGVDAELVIWRGYEGSVCADPRWEIERHMVDEFDQMDLSLLKTPMPEGVVLVGKEKVSPPSPAWAFPSHLLEFWGYHLNNVEGFIDALRQYDILVVSGQGVIIAPFSGVPYVTYPYGADLLESPFGSDRPSKMSLAGWRRAAAHIFGGGNFFRIGDLLGLRNSTYVPILVDTDLYAPKEMPALREELLAGEEGTVFFAPARHNWEWKGNDKIIRAVKLLAERTGKKFKILFAKWGGGDLEKSLKLVEELGVSERCVFLGAMSKPVLHDYIRASDVVLDQFTLGEYGTLALEAMSLERPVIVHMNSLKNGVPLVKAFSTEEIAGAMTDLLENPAKAKDIGRRSREWVVAHHGPAAIVPKFLKVFDSVANGEDAPKFEMLMD